MALGLFLQREWAEPSPAGMVRARLLLGGFYTVALDSSSCLVMAVAQSDVCGWMAAMAGLTSAAAVQLATVAGNTARIRACLSVREQLALRAQQEDGELERRAVEQADVAV
jgi:hypothetical protein